jgi:outer membrane protein TolC
MKTQAGLRPNPEFQFQNENLRPGQTYSRDVDTLALFSQPLDILGKRRQRIAAASESVNSAQAEYQLARWRLSQNVKLAYWEARGTQEVHNAILGMIDNFQKIVDYTSAQLSVGAIPEQDLLRVRLEGERMKISADLAAMDVNRARVELLRQMGRTDFSEPIVLNETLVPGQTIAPLPVEQVLGQRIDVTVARAALAQAEANAKLQGVLARPDLSVTYGYKRTQLPDAIAGVNTTVAGVRVSIPIIDRNQGNRAAAAAEVHRRQQLFAEAQAQARADYAAALQEYQARKAELTDTLTPLREHAANIADIAAAAYREGGTDLLRLLDAERTRLDADLAWTRGVIEYRQSTVRLEGAEGVN